MTLRTKVFHYCILCVAYLLGVSVVIDARRADAKPEECGSMLSAAATEPDAEHSLKERSARIMLSPMYRATRERKILLLETPLTNILTHLKTFVGTSEGMKNGRSKGLTEFFETKDDIEIKVLGKGGYGRVFEVINEDKSFAVKQIFESPFALRATLQSPMSGRTYSSGSARSNARDAFNFINKNFYDHPNVVKLHAFIEGKSGAVVIMDKYENILKDVALDLNVAENREKVAKWISGVLSVIEVLVGTFGKSHCDLHGQNLMVDKNGDLRIIDFGEMMRIGKCAHQSTRLFDQKSIQAEDWDIFKFGETLWQMIAESSRPIEEEYYNAPYGYHEDTRNSIRKAFKKSMTDVDTRFSFLWGTGTVAALETEQGETPDAIALRDSQKDAIYELILDMVDVNFISGVDYKTVISRKSVSELATLARKTYERIVEENKGGAAVMEDGADGHTVSVASCETEAEDHDDLGK